MIRNRYIPVALAAALLLVSPVVLQGQDDVPPPARFRDLLKPGQMVGVIATEANSAYSLTIFGDEQAQTIRGERTENDELQKQVDRITRQLEMESRLAERADLLVARNELQTKLSRPTIVGSRQYGTIYEVSHVGEDYLALDGNNLQRYIPLHSIRSLFRRENLSPQRRFSSSSAYRARSASGFGPRSSGGNQIELAHIDAAKAAEVLRKVFAEPKCEFAFDAASNVLIISSAPDEMRLRILRFVADLDVNVNE